MKEIKFRGRRKDNREWVYGRLVVLDYHNSIDYVEVYQIVLLNGHSFEVNPETVGQFIGRKDCKGVEIYERDIIRDCTGKEYLVIWVDDICAFFLSFIPDVPNTEFNGYVGVVKHSIEFFIPGKILMMDMQFKVIPERSCLKRLRILLERKDLK